MAIKIKIVRDTWQPPTQKLSALPGGLNLKGRSFRLRVYPY